MNYSSSGLSVQAEFAKEIWNGGPLSVETFQDGGRNRWKNKVGVRKHDIRVVAVPYLTLSGNILVVHEQATTYVAKNPVELSIREDSDHKSFLERTSHVLWG